MSDLEARADDYEQRLANAGSTDDLMAGLVRTVKHSKRILWVAVAGLIIDLVLTVFLFFVAGDARSSAHQANANTAAIVKNSARLRVVDHNACVALRVEAKNHNTLVRALIYSVARTDSLPPKEQALRIARYTNTLTSAPPCS